jgi:hypothetical protein
MNGRDLCYRLEDAGLTVRTSDGKVILAPREKITDELRALVLAHKPALVEYLLWREAAEEVQASLPTPFREQTQRHDAVGAGVASQRPEVGGRGPKARLGRPAGPVAAAAKEEGQADCPVSARSVWVGLIRDAATPHGKWQEVVRASDRMACWETLLRHPSPYTRTERRVDYVSA